MLHRQEARRVHTSYRRAFAAPGAAAFVLAGFVARLGHLMTILGIVFLVTAGTGSFGLAGAVSAGYALAYAAVSPLLSRLVDRHRQARVLAPATLANLVARAGLLAAAWIHAPGWSLVLLAGLAGATMPAVGSLVRARWSHLYESSRLLHSALSVESVLDETILIVAPLVVAALATYVDPSAGLVAALVLSAIGLAALTVQRGTEPPPQTARGPAGVTGGAALSVPGFGWLLATVGLVAAASTTIELATVAFSQQHHAAAASGPILAAMAVSSALCGLWYGARDRRHGPHRRLVRTMVLLAAAAWGFVAATGIATLFVAALLYGLTLAPIFIDGFMIVHRIVPARYRTEGLTWLTTAVAVGIALGSAVAGRTIDAWGTRVAFGSAAGCAALAVLVAVHAARQMPAQQPTQVPDGSPPARVRKP
jgi:MFS family permease